MEQIRKEGFLCPRDTGGAIRKCISKYIIILACIGALTTFLGLIAIGGVSKTQSTTNNYTQHDSMRTPPPNHGLDYTDAIFLIIGGIGIASFGYISGLVGYGFADIVDHANGIKRLPPASNSEANSVLTHYKNRMNQENHSE